MTKNIIQGQFSRRGFLTASSIAEGALGLSSLGLSARAFAQNTSLPDLTLGVATYRGQGSYFAGEAGIANTHYKADYAEFAGGNLIVEALACGNPGLSRHNPLQRHSRDVLCSRVHTPQNDAVLQGVGNAMFAQRQQRERP